MANTELKIGNVVVLRSGGPKMIIENIGEYPPYGNRVLCIWFDGKKRMTELFPPEGLNLVEE